MVESESIRPSYKGSDKLLDKVAIITGGDSGIGRAIALHFAREGSDVVIVFLRSVKDARETKKMVEKEKRLCLLFQGDIRFEQFCKRVVQETHKHFGKLSILVNNAGVMNQNHKLSDITPGELLRTFQVNIFSFYYFSNAALEVMDKNGCIINTTSITAYRGSEHLIDYAASKGAVVSFTRSLAKNLAKTGIRVNAVSPGPIWTPLIAKTFHKKALEKFGKNTTMGRAGHPYEVAPAYVYLASMDASYITGQVIHVNGREIVGA